MTYQLRPEQGLIASAKTILLEQLIAAANALENPINGRGDAVHRARRRLKRARALYRLIAAAAPDLRKSENIKLRDIARGLASLRDASALMESLNYLQSFAQNEDEHQALRQALSLLDTQSHQTPESHENWDHHLQNAAAACRDAADLLTSTDIPLRRAKAARVLQKAWKKLLARAHHAISACEEGCEAESFHDLRKVTQTYWMYLSLLRELWPSAFTLKRQSAKQLADVLGHENDLAMLTAAIDQQAARFDNAETLSHVLGMIIRRQQALREEALIAAKALFCDGVELEPAIIAGLWRLNADEHSGAE
jgi:chromosome segregation ATPase